MRYFYCKATIKKLAERAGGRVAAAEQQVGKFGAAGQRGQHPDGRQRPPAGVHQRHHAHDATEDGEQGACQGLYVLLYDKGVQNCRMPQ